MKKYLSFGVIIIVTVLWGIISLFSKPLIQMGFTAMQLVFVRSFFSAGVLALVILFKDKNLFKIKLQDLHIFIGAGVLGFTFCVFCYMGSIYENGAGVGAMLMYSSPIWTIIISKLFFNENINLFKILALFGVVVGCVMVSLGGELKMTLIGAFLGVGSGVGLALINVFSKISANKNYSPLTTQFYVFLVAGIASFPLSKAWEMPSMIIADYYSILYFVLIAIVCTALPYVLYSFAMKRVAVSTAGIIASLEVAVGAFTGFIAFNENIGVLGLLGIVIMIGAMVVLAIKGEDKKAPLNRG